jgi:hypothetical protein
MIPNFCQQNNAKLVIVSNKITVFDKFSNIKINTSPDQFLNLLLSEFNLANENEEFDLMKENSLFEEDSPQLQKLNQLRLSLMDNLFK